MTDAESQKTHDERIARMLRELQSDLADLVASGDMTDEEANAWFNRKADAWMTGGLN